MGFTLLELVVIASQWMEVESFTNLSDSKILVYTLKVYSIHLGEFKEQRLISMADAHTFVLVFGIT